jgi:hypothetical protein
MACVAFSPPRKPPELLHVEGRAAAEEIEGGGALGFGAQAATRWLLGVRKKKASVRRHPLKGTEAASKCGTTGQGRGWREMESSTL